MGTGVSGWGEMVTNEHRTDGPRRSDSAGSDQAAWRRDNFDSLSGLPLPPLFVDRLEQAVALSRLGSAGVAVMAIGLDAAAGQAMDDLVGRVRSCLRRGESACRMAGDEGVLALIVLGDGADALEQAIQPLLDALGDTDAGAISCSIGIRQPDGAADGAADTLIGDAEAAMRRARKAGGNAYRVHGADDECEVQAGSELSAGPRGWAPRGVRVLFADDLELARLVFRDFLEASGCFVDEAENGVSAAAMAAEAVPPYDLVVLDLYMPGGDGFGAAHAIRAREAWLGLSRVPIMALTAGDGEDERQRAAECGIDRFLTKPVSRADLLKAMAEMLPAERTDAAPSGGLHHDFHIPPGLEHLLPAFLDEMLKDQKVLRTLVDGGDRAALADHVHAMRGKCGMFGENGLFDLLGRLENLAPAGGAGEITRLVAKVVERIGHL